MDRIDDEINELLDKKLSDCLEDHIRELIEEKVSHLDVSDFVDIDAIIDEVLVDRGIL
jgi:hypothetical protein